MFAGAFGGVRSLFADRLGGVSVFRRSGCFSCRDYFSGCFSCRDRVFRRSGAGAGFIGGVQDEAYQPGGTCPGAWGGKEGGGGLREMLILPEAFSV